MNKLLDAFKNNSDVKRYIELREIILSNSKCYDALKCKLSDNKAKSSNLLIDDLIEEYIEYETRVANLLSFIKEMIENELKMSE